MELTTEPGVDPTDGESGLPPTRVVIEHVTPEVDGGRFAVKRVVGDALHIEADVFADGHDELAAQVLYRHADEEGWHSTPMRFLGNDHWSADLTVEKMGAYYYRLEAWVDAFGTWRSDFQKWLAANQDVESELLSGAALIASAAGAAGGAEGSALNAAAEALMSNEDMQERAKLALDETLLDLMGRHADRGPITQYDRGQRIQVDRKLAGFSAWYEMFPRSTATRPGKHGTFKDVAKRLRYVAGLGFDVLYFPPIHPIGETNRKGKNNATKAQPGDTGSPWAIGSSLGGHKAIHPELGTLSDFKALIKAAEAHGIEIALDIAYQVSPDHPYVKEHPDWFRYRADGSIRYAENPPKKYEDIYPIDFGTEDWQALWGELESVIRYWIEQGVTVFRVDNPHTKAFAFWEAMIGSVKADHPETIFLSEAFTRPRVRYYLAKLGFTQSYTYFAWRNSKQELTDYLTELTTTEVKDYFRPNFWPNTPDILHETLRTGGRGAFAYRYVLAATLSSNCGIYGPAFELGVNAPREAGSEEYLDSEKYELKSWDLDARNSLRGLIATVNRIRRENPALQWNDTLRFVETRNENLIAYTKTSPDGGNTVLVVVNLHASQTQVGSVRVPLDDLGLPLNAGYQVQDLLTGDSYGWFGEWQYIALDPASQPAHIFLLPSASAAPARSSTSTPT